MSGPTRAGAPAAPARVALVVGAVLALAGCSAAPPTPPTDDRAALQAQLSGEYENLLDDAGLVHNPTGNIGDAPDYYATALLTETRRSLGLEAPTGEPAAPTVEALDVYRERRQIPADWMTFIGASLGVDTVGETDAAAIPADAEEAATTVWLRSYDEAGQEELRSEVERLLVSDGLGIVASWRAAEACRRLEGSCAVPTPRGVAPAELDSVSAILDARAAAELSEMGVEVDGWTPEHESRLAGTAAQLIDATDDGKELEISNLARLVHLADGGTTAFEGYLERADERRDAAGAYLTYADPAGTIANTYTAMMTLGTGFAALVADRPTAQTVDAVLADGATDRVTRLQAWAIAAALRDLTAEEQRTIDEIAAGVEDIAPGADGSAALAALEPLVQLGGAPGDLSIAPVAVTTENEAYAARLIGFARDGSLANSAEILDYYSAYLDDIRAGITDLDADDPHLLTRLLLVSHTPDDVPADEADALAKTIGERVGCEDTPHMMRTSTAPDSPCELNSTRLVIASGVAVGEYGGVL